MPGGYWTTNGWLTRQADLGAEKKTMRSKGVLILSPVAHGWVWAIAIGDGSGNHDGVNDAAVVGMWIALHYPVANQSGLSVAAEQAFRTADCGPVWSAV